MIKKWAMVKDGVVKNLVLWDGSIKTWAPPDGVVMIETTKPLNIGDLWDGQNFSKPEPSINSEEVITNSEENSINSSDI